MTETHTHEEDFGAKARLMTPIGLLFLLAEFMEVSWDIFWQTVAPILEHIVMRFSQSRFGFVLIPIGIMLDDGDPEE